MPNLLPTIITTCIAAISTSSRSLAFAPNRVRYIASNAPLLAAAAVANTRGGGGGGGGGGEGGGGGPPPTRDHGASASESAPSAAGASDASSTGDDDGRDDGGGPSSSSELESLLERARRHLDEKDADGAFAALARAYGLDPASPAISAMFEACLGLKVELAEGRYRGWRGRLDSSNSAADGADGDGADDADADDVLSERELNDLFQDRMGLSSLFIDREYYDEAGIQLRRAIEEATFWLNRSPRTSQRESGDGDGRAAAADFSSTRFEHWRPQIDRARYLLYRTNAACCRWDAYFEDGDRLRRSLLLPRDDDDGGGARPLHPFDALKFPCVSLGLASDVARSYARRALESVGAAAVDDPSPKPKLPRRTVTASGSESRPLGRKIRVGYVSPDFTSRHPLAFLMQHVFRFHDESRFEVYIYSVSSSSRADDGPEVRAIRDSSQRFATLSPSAMNPPQMYERMMEDELDILVDLCGYAGTSVMAEVMASRARLRQEDRRRRFPLHVSYMGFPGSVGSSRVWDYSVFDRIVVPPATSEGIRECYDEALVYMPHCYFVNSHRTVIGEKRDGIMVSNEKERDSLRERYGIHPSAFVYCCHSRPDKIDPSTFRSWMRAIERVKEARGDDATLPILWLLRSGEEMERNLRSWVRRKFGQAMEGCLAFADVAERSEHLRRLGIADVFLDTPAYNAHTLGCDALYMGVPMISLLRPLEGNEDDVAAGSKLDLEFAADIDPTIDPGVGGRDGRRTIATEKLASRVGGSLLAAIGLRDDLVHPSMSRYEDAMVRCALDGEWFRDLRRRLVSSRDSSPLFDTERWVRNLEAAFRTMTRLDSEDEGDALPDIVVSDYLE